MKTIAQRNLELYNKIAHTYNSLFPTHPHPEFLELFTNKIAKGSKILDVGCAGGRDTNYFTNKGFKAVGLDFSSGQISYAKIKYPQANFVQGDMLRLPDYFSKNEFDAIYCYAALDHLKKSDFPKALINFNSVLKNNSILFLVTRQGKGVLWTNDKYSTGIKRRFTLITDKNLCSLLNKMGFEIKELTSFRSITRKNMEFLVALCKKTKDL